MRLKVVIQVVAMVVAGPALADQYIGFQSPTGNIQCGIYSGSGGTSVLGSRPVATQTYRKAPAGCEFDWGNSFEVQATGKGYLACVSDSMADPSNQVLRYGQAVSLGGISCVSAKTGMTCTNAAGHGFSVAKAKQKLF